MVMCAGEQGKVEESMREMAAIEALKSEKSEKEVRTIFFHDYDKLKTPISSSA
jgi:hypothetical protein